MCPLLFCIIIVLYIGQNIWTIIGIIWVSHSYCKLAMTSSLYFIVMKINNYKYAIITPNISINKPSIFKCNGQKKKDKRTHNCLQTIKQKTKDQLTRTPLKTGDELWCTGKVSSSCVLIIIRSFPFPQN
jgi:hypothetical protein